MPRVLKVPIAVGILILFSSSGYAQDVNKDGFVSFLVPIVAAAPIAGLHGSNWTTELWLHTAIDAGLRSCGPVIPIGEPCAFHKAGVTELAFPREVENLATALVYDVPLILAPSIQLSSRLLESAHAQPAGVDVPIVREDRFFTGPVRFLGVPNSPRTRVALRLYDPRRRPGVTVRVELLDSRDTLIADTIVSLKYDNVTFYGEPGFAAIYDLSATFPQLAGYQRFDVRVSTLAKAEFWGLVSVTDNETQQVLLITAAADAAKSSLIP